MKLIDANALKAELEIMPIDIGYGDIDRALQVVESQPEAVVRCKDCKFSKITIDGKYCKYCTILQDSFGVDDAVYLDADFYCGYGKRRKDGENV
jgi:hypothetical protein